jgi:hypothetical protein
MIYGLIMTDLFPLVSQGGYLVGSPDADLVRVKAAGIPASILLRSRAKSEVSGESRGYLITLTSLASLCSPARGPLSSSQDRAEGRRVDQTPPPTLLRGRAKSGVSEGRREPRITLISRASPFSPGNRLLDLSPGDMGKPSGGAAKGKSGAADKKNTGR